MAVKGLVFAVGRLLGHQVHDPLLTRQLGEPLFGYKIISPLRHSLRSCIILEINLLFTFTFPAKQHDDHQFARALDQFSQPCLKSIKKLFIKVCCSMTNF